LVDWCSTPSLAVFSISAISWRELVMKIKYSDNMTSW